MDRSRPRPPRERYPGETERHRPVRTVVEVEAPMLDPMPTLQQQFDDPAGILEAWFHDTNLKEGITYSYRFRLALINPLLGRFKESADENDAKVQTLQTPWSDWSEPVEAKRPTEMFLVGDAPMSKMVVVDVFTQRWGQRVVHRFSVGRGEPVGGDVAKKLLRLDNGQLQKVVVNFKTGAVAVDFDFKKKEPIPGTNFFRTTAELLYLDADGRLQTRTRFEDTASPRYKELLNETRQAAPAAPSDRY